MEWYSPSIRQDFAAAIRLWGATNIEIIENSSIMLSFLRKMFRIAPEIMEVFDATAVREAGVTGEIYRLAGTISDLVTKANAAYAARHGSDLFKLTNKTLSTLTSLRDMVEDYDGYNTLISNLYFVFYEGPGERLSVRPPSFSDINDLRTDLQHDVDHGKQGKIVARRKKLASTFSKYSGASAPGTMAPERFPMVQVNLLSAIETDLRALAANLSTVPNSSAK
jgi:hypothetical protein